MAPKGTKRKASSADGPVKGPLTGKMVECNRSDLPRAIASRLSSTDRVAKLEVGNLLKPGSRTYICASTGTAQGTELHVSSKILGKLLEGRQPRAPAPHRNVGEGTFHPVYFLDASF
jgi:hypothetical protein